MFVLPSILCYQCFTQYFGLPVFVLPYIFCYQCFTQYFGLPVFYSLFWVASVCLLYPVFCVTSICFAQYFALPVFVRFIQYFRLPVFVLFTKPNTTELLTNYHPLKKTFLIDLKRGMVFGAGLIRLWLQNNRCLTNQSERGIFNQGFHCTQHVA